jgi:hypothetical protein
VNRKTNRPDMRDRKPSNLFHDAGPTGWQGRYHPRDITKPPDISERDFHHLHDRFVNSGENA